MGVEACLVRIIYKNGHIMQYNEERRDRKGLYGIWIDAGRDEPLSGQHIREAYSGVERRIGGGMMRRILAVSTRVAAVMAIPLMLLSLWLLIRDAGRQEIAWQHVYVPKGETGQVVLADGSEIWLNSDSYMVYPDRFDGDVRKIFLCGEAFADIYHDESRPFIVETQYVDIRVLGTVFNVKSYADDSLTETRLVEGSLAVDFGESSELLRPGDQLTVDHATMQGTMDRFDTGSYVSWQQGSYVFRNSSLEEIVRYLERIFDERILICDSELLDNTYFVVFSRNMDLDDMLKALDVRSEMRILHKDDAIELHLR